jgi:hypothetical protein
MDQRRNPESGRWSGSPSLPGRPGAGKCRGREGWPGGDWPEEGPPSPACLGSGRGRCCSRARDDTGMGGGLGCCGGCETLLTVCRCRPWSSATAPALRAEAEHRVSWPTLAASRTRDCSRAGKDKFVCELQLLAVLEVLDGVQEGCGGAESAMDHRLLDDDGRANA